LEAVMAIAAGGPPLLEAIARSSPESVLELGPGGGRWGDPSEPLLLLTRAIGGLCAAAAAIDLVGRSSDLSGVPFLAAALRKVLSLGTSVMGFATPPDGMNSEGGANIVPRLMLDLATLLVVRRVAVLRAGSSGLVARQSEVRPRQGALARMIRDLFTVRSRRSAGPKALGEAGLVAAIPQQALPDRLGADRFPPRRGDDEHGIRVLLAAWDLAETSRPGVCYERARLNLAAVVAEGEGELVL